MIPSRRVPSPRQERDGIELDGDDEPRLHRHATEMPQQAKASDIGTPGRPCDRKARPDIVELGHRCYRAVGDIGRRNVGLDGRGDDPNTERLGEDEILAPHQVRRSSGCGRGAPRQ